jgi:hypothetical protein
MMLRMRRVALPFLLAMAAAAQQPPAAGRVVGRVVGPLREPVPAAKVWLEREPGSAAAASTTTDGSGCFVLSRVPWGRWYVRASIPGSNVGCDFFYLSPARPEAFASLRVGDAARIRGRVTGPDGKAIAGAHLVSENDLRFDWYIPEFTVFAAADADGRFELDGVLLGPTTVRAWAPGFDVAEQRLHLAAEATLDFALVQGKGSSVTVRLRDASAAQLAAARATIMYMHSGTRLLPLPLQKCAFAADGSCLLAGLPADYALEVRVTAPGVAVEPDPARVDSADKAGQLDRTIELRAVAPDMREVRGRLLDPRGRPLDALTVEASQWDEWTSVVMTDADGRFTIRDRPPYAGGFRLQLASDSHVLDLLGDYRFRGEVRIGEATWTAGPRPVLEFTAIPAASVTGRIVDGDGHGIPNADVQLRPRLDGQNYYGGLRARTDAQGRFRFARVDGRDERPFAVRVEGEAGFALTDGFTLIDGGVRELGDVRVQPAASVGGVVHGPDGKPLPGARVVLRRCDPATGTQADGSRIEMVGDRTGSFRFVGLEPRGWRLFHCEVGEAEKLTPGPWFELRAGGSESAVLEPAK